MESIPKELGSKGDFIGLMQRACHTCSACKLGRFQAPPILAIGNKLAPIVLVAGARPIVYGETETFSKIINLGGKLLEHEIEEKENQDRLMYKAERLARQYLIETGEYEAITDSFQEDVLELGKVTYTYAVRCQTEDDLEVMGEACSVFTIPLLENAKGVILWGPESKEILLGDSASKLDYGKIARLSSYNALITMIHSGDQPEFDADQNFRWIENLMTALRD